MEPIEIDNNQIVSQLALKITQLTLENAQLSAAVEALQAKLGGK